MFKNDIQVYVRTRSTEEKKFNVRMRERGTVSHLRAN
jgi:hypothetical protein